jgi:hypothetical protein
VDGTETPKEIQPMDHEEIDYLGAILLAAAAVPLLLGFT